jgi:hypothetical protein
MPSLGQVLPNFREQLPGTERLRHIIIAAGCARLLFFATERIGGDRDDRYRSQRGVGLDLARGGVAVHDRQSDIHQNEIRPLPCDRRQRLFAAFDDLALEAKLTVTHE